VFAAEDSAVVAQEDEDGGMGLPERAKKDLVAEGVGKSDACETLAEGFWHEGMIEEVKRRVKMARSLAVGRERPALEGLRRRGGILHVG
jgi:hypothetical protein